MRSTNDAKSRMNDWGKRRQPFIFILDFDLQKPIVLGLEEVAEHRIVYDILGFSNVQSASSTSKELQFSKFPISFELYCKRFELVQHHIACGNTFLLNLTAPTRIETNYSLSDLFFGSTAKFKLLYDNFFVVFSPEIFIRIEDYTISSYPMKGTIDASIPNAEGQLLSDEKESAEHATIVDLIRNDLSMVASNVRVERYRFVDRIRTNEKELIQISSKINGCLDQDYRGHLGDILYKLLPAGSISGAPKKKTLEIIKEAELYSRGYYTGVFGYFDGNRLESGVMIRFIENIDGTLYYKSGGGITASSNAESEYQELVNKVYVPLS